MHGRVFLLHRGSEAGKLLRNGLACVLHVEDPHLRCRKDRAFFPDLTRKVIADGKCGMFLCHHGLKFSSLGSIYHAAVKA